MYDSTAELMAPPPFAYMGSKSSLADPQGQLSPVSPVHEGITPLASVPELALTAPADEKKTAETKTAEVTVKKPAPKKPKVSRWILADLWFNTYRKFFTLITLLNLTGIILTTVGKFPYAEKHLGALVLGNLLTAILMRNELFGRFLYLVLIYGLRWVRGLSPFRQHVC